ncbi:MAG: hypothetical protein H6815_03425 [Phycisphaeraceae bacterium]|nr:hypothetical protein [Phycisphaerales bacterium]MCB9859478.1 hypothetical protein [Phycisphaeraceae bacterium]
MSDQQGQRWWVGVETQLNDTDPPSAPQGSLSHDALSETRRQAVPVDETPVSSSSVELKPVDIVDITVAEAGNNDDSLGDELVDENVLAQIKQAGETAATRRRARVRNDLFDLNARVTETESDLPPHTNGAVTHEPRMVDVGRVTPLLPGRDAERIDEEADTELHSPFDDRRKPVNHTQTEASVQEDSDKTLATTPASSDAVAPSVQSQPMSSNEPTPEFVRIPVWYLPWKWWRSLIGSPLTAHELRSIAVHEDDDAASFTLTQRVAINLADVGLLIGGLSSVLIAALGIWSLFQAMILGFGAIGNASRVVLGDVLNHCFGAAQVLVLAPVPVVLSRAVVAIMLPAQTKESTSKPLLESLRRPLLVVLAVCFGVVLISMVRECFRASSLSFLDLFLRTCTLSIIGVCMVVCSRWNEPEPSH